MTGVFLVYTGLVAVLSGLASLLSPPRFLGIAGPGGAALVAGLGGLLLVAGALFPAPLARASGRQRLDAMVPAWQFGEFHETRVKAPPDRTYAALRGVTAEEIRLFRTLTFIRSPRRPWPITRASPATPRRPGRCSS